VKIHNTLTKTVDEFAPLDGQTARIYTCGPTVYNDAHIGNLSSYIYADILRRALRLAGFEIRHVINFTDVDDKTIRRSREQYPELEPNEALQKLTRHYEQVFRNDLVSIGNDISDIKFVRATESIDDIQNLIRKLLDVGAAYVADDGIYFDIAAYRRERKYGQLSKIDLPSEMRARIDNDEYDKESAQDFALWKKQKPGEPAWDFEIAGNTTRGRPGWHIECSAMSVKNLGQPFDIHTGAVDLIFPHHENEIAQSTAGDQPETYARWFVHNEHLLVDGAKMAKSKNNFYTLNDLVKKGFSPLDFRMLILQSHFQSPSNFSWDNLTAARGRLKAWQAVAELRWQTTDVDDDGQQEIVRGLLVRAGAALMENLNTPEALKHIDEAISFISKDPSNISHEALRTIFDFVDRNLGLSILSSTPDIDDNIKDMISIRQTERASGDYARSDEIRDSLRENGIELRDTSAGVIWARN
jgi:cysteinyl-tRNA synthetase